MDSCIVKHHYRLEDNALDTIDSLTFRDCRVRAEQHFATKAKFFNYWSETGLCKIVGEDEVSLDLVEYNVTDDNDIKVVTGWTLIQKLHNMEIKML